MQILQKSGRSITKYSVLKIKNSVNSPPLELQGKLCQTWDKQDQQNENETKKCGIKTVQNTRETVTSAGLVLKRKKSFHIALCYNSSSLSIQGCSNVETHNILRLLDISERRESYNFLQPWRILDWHSTTCLRAARALAFVHARNEGNYLCLLCSLPPVMSLWGWRERLKVKYDMLLAYIHTPSIHDFCLFVQSRWNYRSSAESVNTDAVLFVMHFLILHLKVYPVLHCLNETL